MLASMCTCLVLHVHLTTGLIHVVHACKLELISEIGCAGRAAAVFDMRDYF
jgi:hypothetical protein